LVERADLFQGTLLECATNTFGYATLADVAIEARDNAKHSEHDLRF
jgi:hypothetical protein